MPNIKTLYVRCKDIEAILGHIVVAFKFCFEYIRWNLLIKSRFSLKFYSVHWELFNDIKWVVIFSIGPKVKILVNKNIWTLY